MYLVLFILRLLTSGHWCLMDLAADKSLVHQVLLPTFSQSLVSSILQGTENTMYTHVLK